MSNTGRMKNLTAEWLWSTVLPALIWGVAWWADAVDFMPSHTNAGVGE